MALKLKWIYGSQIGPGWRGAVQVPSTVPKLDCVLLEFCEFKRMYNFGSLQCSMKELPLLHTFKET